MSDPDPSPHGLDARGKDDGLTPAIAPDAGCGGVRMFARLNRESLQEAVNSGRRVLYWSRVRQRPRRTGEESGHERRLCSVPGDCDGGVRLLAIERQGGIACATGRESWFFHQLQGESWVPLDPVLRDPKDIYGQ